VSGVASRKPTGQEVFSGTLDYSGKDGSMGATIKGTKQ